MPDTQIADDVRDFILERIDSVAQIEALLLIRSNPRARFHAADIARRLYSGRLAVEEALSGLCGAGLLVRVDDTYRLDGVPASTLTLIDRLLDSYSRHLIPVTNIVHSKLRRASARMAPRGRTET